MIIYYLGHSSFLLVTKNGTRIVTDPYSPEIGYAMPKISADAVTVSHHHYDHDAVNLVGGNPKVFEGECNAAFNDIKITSYKCCHDGCGGAKRGKNYAFKFEADGLSVCHLGDLGEERNACLCMNIGHVDTLLIPVGGNYTIDAEAAAWYVRKINPATAIPMHYAIEGGKIDIDGVDGFLNIFGEPNAPERQFEPYRKDSYNQPTKIILMERRK